MDDSPPDAQLGNGFRYPVLDLYRGDTQVEHYIDGDLAMLMGGHTSIIHALEECDLRAASDRVVRKMGALAKQFGVVNTSGREWTAKIRKEIGRRGGCVEDVAEVVEVERAEEEYDVKAALRKAMRGM